VPAEELGAGALRRVEPTNILGRKEKSGRARNQHRSSSFSSYGRAVRGPGPGDAHSPPQASKTNGKIMHALVIEPQVYTSFTIEDALREAGFTSVTLVT